MTVDIDQCRRERGTGNLASMAFIEHQPGDPAPSSGEYEELNVFGTPTGRIAEVAKGEQLPASARGFTWRPLAQHSLAELRERAAEYRRMAETARTTDVMGSLRKLAERFDTLADRRQQDQGGTESGSAI